MKLIYGKEINLMDMTLRDLIKFNRKLEREAGVKIIMDGFVPRWIQVPCELPGMVQIMKLK